MAGKQAPNPAQLQLQGFVQRPKPAINPNRVIGGVPGRQGPLSSGNKLQGMASPPTGGPTPAPLQMPQAAITPAQAQSKGAQQALQSASKIATPVRTTVTSATTPPHTQHPDTSQLAVYTSALANPQSQYNRRRQAREIGAVTNIASQIAGSAQGMANRIAGALSAAPMPGGIFLMLAILVLFLWAAVPVNNGLTRAQLFYLTLTGKTALNPFQPILNSAGVTSDNASFGAAPGVQELSYVVGGAAPTVPGSSPTNTPPAPNYDFGSSGAPQYM